MIHRSVAKYLNCFLPPRYFFTSFNSLRLRDLIDVRNIFFFFVSISHPRAWRFRGSTDQRLQLLQIEIL